MPKNASKKISGKVAGFANRSKFTLFLVLVLLSVGGGIIGTGFLVPIAFVFNHVKDTADDLFNDIDIEEYSGLLSSQTVMYANDGQTVLGTFYAQDRIIVPLSSISKNLQNAVIAREDKRFYSHAGIDLYGTARAFVVSYFGGSDGQLQGGSTITQQYVKNLLVDNALQSGDPIAQYHAKEQTLYRKLKEAKYAYELENKLSKDQILEGYLNVAPFGPNVYGAESSARRYFSKSASDLTPGEGALIAGITKSPVNYDPLTHPEVAQEQRDIVLRLMCEQGFITVAERDAAVAQNVVDMLHVQTIPVGCQSAAGAAFFCDYVTNVILNNEKFGRTKAERRRFLYQGGLKIYTTLDKHFQTNAEAQTVSSIPPDDSSGLEIAITTVEPGTGKILAMAQNRPYNASQTDKNALDTSINYNAGQDMGGSIGFSPGSTFKPLILTDWLKNGHSLNESFTNVRYPFAPSQFACGLPGEYFAPKNADGSISYQTPLIALERSTNVSFVHMGTILGLCSIVKTAREMGFSDSRTGGDPEMYPSFLIGSMNSTPLTMANSYATIASGGTHCSPIAITKIIDSKGDEHPIPSANCKKVLEDGVANTMMYALHASATLGLAKTANIPGFDAGIKTGTSEDATHLWTVGFVKQASSALWIGNAQYDVPIISQRIGGQSNYWNSSNLPAPIWQKYMVNSLKDAGYTNQAFPAPEKALLAYTSSYASSGKSQ
ncbi:MAG: penicillin-binding protein [Candidatus Ancillula sp.]|jgi:membrane peptidoglycan carboxypeptidase|nr:penicillin-binding protein [Candidatus Ancillula sp.]